MGFQLVEARVMSRENVVRGDANEGKSLHWLWQ